MNETQRLELDARYYAQSIHHSHERAIVENIARKKREWWRRNVEALGVPIPPSEVLKLYDQYAAWLVAMGYEPPSQRD